MLSQLLVVRLKAAENAFKEGRLDEAYRLATARDVREHRRGADVLASLTERFIQRARSHFQAERFSEALMDLDRAEAGGVSTAEIAELRDHIHKVQSEQRRVAQSRRDRLGAAKRRIEQGSLLAGKRMLDQASQGDPEARQLRQHAEERLADIEHAIELARDLLSRGQLSQAADRIRRAKRIDAHNAALARVESEVCAEVLRNARGALVDGRIGRAEDELACLGDLGNALPGRKELDDMLSLARQATQSVRKHDYGEARRHCMSLHRLLPKAAWLKQEAAKLRALDDAQAELVAGPLGESVDSDKVNLPAEMNRVAAKPPSPDDTVALPGRVGATPSAGDRLLLLVDGGGSYLIIRTDTVSVGRAASNHPADLPIFSDLGEQHANVSRVEDDYFLFATRDVDVAGRKTRHQLLRDGDRIVFGRKAKLTFRIPSRRSPTAVLDLSDTTKMPNDVRRTILFSRHATIGNGAKAHVYCRHSTVPLILFERRGSLWIRPKNDGHMDTTPRELVLGRSVEMAGTSLVLEPWAIRSPGGSM